MESLPTNILVKIFSYNLNSSDIISISATCKKFNEVAKNFLPNFPPVRIDLQHLYLNKNIIVYKNGKEKNFNALIETTSSFQNFILVNFNKDNLNRLNNKWLEIFKKHNNVRIIRIKSDLLDVSSAVNLIHFTSKLEHLEFEIYRIVEESNTNVIGATIPSLKSLKIYSFSDKTVKVLIKQLFDKCTSLKSLSLKAFIVSREDVEDLNEFICNQSSLENLELIGLDTQNTLFKFNEKKIDRFSVTIKKLNVEHNGFSINLQKFSEFMQRQNSLKEVITIINYETSLSKINFKFLYFRFNLYLT